MRRNTAGPHCGYTSEKLSATPPHDDSDKFRKVSATSSLRRRVLSNTTRLGKPETVWDGDCVKVGVVLGVTVCVCVVLGVTVELPRVLVLVCEDVSVDVID